MARAVIGIIGNQHLINDDYVVHGVGTMLSEAIAEVSDCLPLLVPPDPELMPLADLCAACDGFLFTGGRPNVHPEEYGHEETPAHGTFNRRRDRLALPLIRACVERGQPILAVCLGFQELNVAMGGTLHPEIRDLPGRMNHRMPPDGTLEEKFELRHDVTFNAGGPFAAIMGSNVVRTNTLHGQGIDTPGARLVVDGWAEDGTPEAVYVRDAPGFAMGVQWHPEWNAAADPVSRALFEAFGESARDWRAGPQAAQRRA